VGRGGQLDAIEVERLTADGPEEGGGGEETVPLAYVPPGRPLGVLVDAARCGVCVCVCVCGGGGGLLG
jgi:hypothetical protein